MLKADLPWRPLDVTVEETVLLLVERWDAVSAVAAALLASPRALTGRECVELVAAHPPVMMDGDWWRALTETRWAE